MENLAYIAAAGLLVGFLVAPPLGLFAGAVVGLCKENN